MDWLADLRGAAVAAHDYRRADYLHTLLEVLGPRPPLTLADAAPAGTDAKAAFFLKNG